MKGRTGFVIGVAVGYALGARAGRQPELEVAPSPTSEPHPAAPAIEAPVDPPTKTQEFIGKQLRAASERLRASS